MKLISDGTTCWIVELLAQQQMAVGDIIYCYDTAARERLQGRETIQIDPLAITLLCCCWEQSPSCLS